MSASKDRQESLASQRLSLRVGGQEFAIDAAKVRELRGYSVPTPVPQAPQYIVGLLDLRGTIVPVIDLALRLGMPALKPGPTSVIVVVETERGLVGLQVDEVCDLISAADSPLQMPAIFSGDKETHFVSGAIALPSRIVSVIDTHNVLGAEFRP